MGGAKRFAEIEPDQMEGLEGGLDWLLGFLDRDLSHLKRAEVRLLGLEAALFAGANRAVSLVPTDEDVLRQHYLDEPLPQASSLNITELRQVQAELTAGLKKLRSGHQWKMRDAPTHWYLAGSEGGFLRLRHEGSPVSVFLARVAEVLRHGWPKIRTCARKECPKLLRKTRKKIYCSTRCSDIVRQVRFVRSHGKRKRDYAAEYERRQRDKTGRNVVVAGRRRAR